MNGCSRVFLSAAGFICGFFASLFLGIALNRLTAIHLPDPVPIAAAGGILGAILPYIADWYARRAAKTRATIEAENDRKKREQESIAASIKRRQDELEERKASFIKVSMTAQEETAKLLRDANRHISRAEAEFLDGAFAPFWDEIEHATNELAAYRQIIDIVNDRANAYQEAAARLSVKIPSFLASEVEVADARPVAERLGVIVRKAQKDFQFASIYEHRKTNQLLYAGFSSLGSAISSLGNTIAASLDSLAESVQASLEDILQATNYQTERIESVSEHHLRELNEHKNLLEAGDHAQKDLGEKYLERDEKQSKMLDNIQRDRKPWP